MAAGEPTEAARVHARRRHGQRRGRRLAARCRHPRIGSGAGIRVHAETKERPIDRFVREQPFLLPRAPRWSAEGQAVPADLSGIAIQQHDLSIYDAIGDAIGRAAA